MENIIIISGIGTVVLGIVAFKFGATWQQLKIVAKLSVDTLTDDKITPEEAQLITVAVLKLIK